MRIHFFQHAATEGPAQVEVWAANRGHAMATTHWYLGESAPDPAGIDFLIILGGGMNIYQYRDHPWLSREKEVIAEVIRLGKPVLGICLGAQLIADVMGGKVTQNAFHEVGWFPIRTLPAARENPLFAHWPEETAALHWHGDTFSIPPGATLLASSEACPHQAFAIGQKVVGLQYHIEVRPEDVRSWVAHEPGPLAAGKYVQSFEEILAGDRHIAPLHVLLAGLLDAMAAG